VTPLKLEPRDFSVASHGNVNIKEGNKSGHAHRSKQRKSWADQLDICPLKIK
jgi:hypothetical protein